MSLSPVLRANGPAAIIFVRLGVGLVFFLEGLKKFLFPADWGAGRFARIAIPDPAVMAPFVGVIEVVCGALLLAGLATRLAAVPLLIDISVAILTTKVPILIAKGFWPMEAEARDGLRDAHGIAIPHRRRCRALVAGCATDRRARALTAAHRYRSIVRMPTRAQRTA